LINVGPTSYGKIAPVFEERLRQMGSWLKVNGEAIYSSVPWKYQNDTINPNVWSVDSYERKHEIYFVCCLIGIHHRKMVNLYMQHFLSGQVIQLK
jgi:alpha-L-fucosidase